MSRVRFTKVAVPATPAANKSEAFVDTADRRLKQIDDLGTVNVLTPDGMDKNYLDNGGFAVCQRLAVANTAIPSPSATVRVLTADRWGHTTGNVTTPQYQQVDTIAATETGLQARFYGKYTQITNAAKNCISQVIPAIEVAKLRGKTVRLQVKLKVFTGSARTMRLGLLQLTSAGTFDTMPATFISAFGADGTDPTWGTNLTAITPSSSGLDNTSVSGAALSCSVTTTWQRFSGLFAIPSNCLNLVAVIFNNAAGTAADAFGITEADLHDGQEVYDFYALPFAMELSRCQRFYNKSFAQGTAPAQNAGQTGAIEAISGKASTAALAGIIYVKYPVVMFKVPTVTIYCPTEASAQIDRLSGATPIAHTATAQQDGTDSGVTVTSTGTANTAVGDIIGLHYAADADL